jgi:hypothetical protein
MRKTIEIMTIALLAGAVLTGCEYKFKPHKTPALAGSESLSEPDIKPYADLEKELLNDQNAVTKETTASDIAARLSEKYGQAVEDLKRLQDKHRDALDKDKVSQAHITKLQTDLARAEKELTEANTMLLEMRTELTQWKKDVLGFRNEMRQSQKAMLDAVARLHVVIGGGVAIEESGTETSKAPTAPIASNTEDKTGETLR